MSLSLGVDSVGVLWKVVFDFTVGVLGKGYCWISVVLLLVGVGSP